MECLGLLLPDEAIHASVALRLGALVQQPHWCSCGATADALGHDNLSCHRKTIRMARHAALNDVIRRALAAAGLVAILRAVWPGPGVRAPTRWHHCLPVQARQDVGVGHHLCQHLQHPHHRLRLCRRCRCEICRGAEKTTLRRPRPGLKVCAPCRGDERRDWTSLRRPPAGHRQTDRPA